MTPNRMDQWKSVIAASINDPDQLLGALDAENDETAVRSRLAAGKFNTWQSGIVSEWLRRKDAERMEASSARAEARSEEALAVAKEANDLASKANDLASKANAVARSASRWAMWATITALIAITITTKDQLFMLIFSFL